MKDHILVRDGNGQRWCPKDEYDANPERFEAIEPNPPKAKAKAKTKPATQEA